LHAGPPEDTGSLRDDLERQLTAFAGAVSEPVARRALPGFIADLTDDPALAARFASAVTEPVQARLAAGLDRAVARGELRARTCRCSTRCWSARSWPTCSSRSARRQKASPPGSWPSWWPGSSRRTGPCRHRFLRHLPAVPVHDLVEGDPNRGLEVLARDVAHR